MALDNYANLQVEIADWLNRGDLTSRIPTFITLAEAKISRRLRRFTSSATLTLPQGANEIDLPAAVAELRSAHLVTGIASLDTALQIGTEEQMATVNASRYGGVGRPVMARALLNKVYFAPPADQSYTVAVTYFNALVPLSTTNPTNEVLTLAPDLYLCGALMYAEPFLDNDERIATWQAGFEAALAELEIVRDREEFSASVKKVSLGRVF